MVKKNFNLILLTLLVTLFNSCYNNKLDEIYVDAKLDELNKVFNSLCIEKRNDNLKLRFQKLEDEIFNLGQEISESKSLSYDEQIKLSKYYIHKLKTYPQLYTLIETHKITCW